jgi:hypothetical protein
MVRLGVDILHDDKEHTSSNEPSIENNSEC